MDPQTCQTIKLNIDSRKLKGGETKRFSQNKLNSWILFLQEMCQVVNRQKEERHRNRAEFG